jgi:hypothetical protein
MYIIDGGIRFIYLITSGNNLLKYVNKVLYINDLHLPPENLQQKISTYIE